MASSDARPRPRPAGIPRGDPCDEDHVVLVDPLGEPVGTMPKLEAHRPPGWWHVAFSAMLRRPDGRMLLQRRARSKYHFGGRWSNSCCSHPAPGETVGQSVRRRVPQELGVHVPEHGLRLVGSFTYMATDVTSGLVEKELDHVVLVEGFDRGTIEANPHEIEELAWVTMAEAHSLCHDEAVTPWLRHVLDLIAIQSAPGWSGPVGSPGQ